MTTGDNPFQGPEGDKQVPADRLLAEYGLRRAALLLAAVNLLLLVLNHFFIAPRFEAIYLELGIRLPVVTEWALEGQLSLFLALVTVALGLVGKKAKQPFWVLLAVLGVLILGAVVIPAAYTIPFTEIVMSIGDAE